MLIFGIFSWFFCGASKHIYLWSEVEFLLSNHHFCHCYRGFSLALPHPDILLLQLIQPLHPPPLLPPPLPFPFLPIPPSHFHHSPISLPDFLLHIATATIRCTYIKTIKNLSQGPNQSQMELLNVLYCFWYHLYCLKSNRYCLKLHHKINCFWSLYLQAISDVFIEFLTKFWVIFFFEVWKSVKWFKSCDFLL